MSNLIITITGPSCSGKTFLTQMMVDTGKFAEVVSTTTRPQRVGEVNGGTYHFVTPEEFMTIEMLECIEFNGNIYGGSVAEFQKQFASGLIPVIIVEPNGMVQVNKNALKQDWHVINVFVKCPQRLQAERFLGRFAQETKAQWFRDDPSDLEKVMTEYVGRMVTMQGTEADWFELYLNGITDVSTETESMIIDQFGKENEQEVLDSIVLKCITAVKNE